MRVGESIERGDGEGSEGGGDDEKVVEKFIWEGGRDQKECAYTPRAFVFTKFCLSTVFLCLCLCLSRVCLQGGKGS